ncbi:MAG: hypothetical protein HOE86_00165, partial [Gemmatimonadetes bacterium]|nr:hypothetical protein [Gemmatimonadota bacterium]
MHELAQRITHLGDQGEDAEIVEDIDTSHALALSIKPYVDRLISLQHLMNPVGGVIEKREQIQELQEELAEDIALIEHATTDLDEVDPSLLQDLQTEIAAAKRDRRIEFTDDAVADEDADEDSSAEADSTALQERSTEDRLRAIFGARFIDTERLGEMLGGQLSDEELANARGSLEQAWQRLVSLPQMRQQVTEGRLKSLRRAFSEYALVYRTTTLPDGSPCHLAGLRDSLSGRFVQSSERSLWYSKLGFYR